MAVLCSVLLFITPAIGVLMSNSVLSFVPKQRFSGQHKASLTPSAHWDSIQGSALMFEN